MSVPERSLSLKIKMLKVYSLKEFKKEYKDAYKKYLQASANLQCIWEATFPNSTLDDLWIKNEETEIIIKEIKKLQRNLK